MIDKAQDYVWATARVLEQRRFEYLFGDGGDAAAVNAALEPYKTARRRLRLRARARRARPDEPAAAHLDRARSARGARRDRPGHRRPPRDDHRARRRRARRPPDARAVRRAPRGGASATEGTLLATALIYARLSSGDASVEGRREAFCWNAVEAIEQDAPVRGRVRDHVPGRRAATASARRRRPSGSARLVASRTSSAPSPRATRGRGPPPARLRLPPDSARARVVQRRRDRGLLDHLASQQHEHGGWEVTWATGRPRSRSSGAGW